MNLIMAAAEGGKLTNAQSVGIIVGGVLAIWLLTVIFGRKK